MSHRLAAMIGGRGWSLGGLGAGPGREGRGRGASGLHLLMVHCGHSPASAAHSRLSPCLSFTVPSVTSRGRGMGMPRSEQHEAGACPSVQMTRQRDGSGDRKQKRRLEDAGK